MGKYSSIITIVSVFLIIILIAFALLKANNPVRSLVTQADYLTEGEKSFVEIGTYTSQVNKDNSELIKRLIAEQDIKYAYYNLGEDDNNLFYSQAVECSSNFERRQEIHDFIRENQPTRTDIYAKANELKINIGVFQKCIEIDQNYKIKVDQINDRIASARLSKIPAFIINGEVYDGPINFEAISVAIAQSKAL